MQNANIKIKNLSKSFGDLAVLNNINFIFESEKSYAITGVSGSGKSTLLHLIAGFDAPTSGEVLFDGSDVNKFSLIQKQLFLNNKIGFILQEPCLIQELSVLENVMLKGLISSQDYKSASTRALEILSIVGLQDKVNSYPSQLSGGQQQRVSISRAIFNKPEFILADEPTANLDKDNALLIIDILLNLNKRYSTGLIISTHDFSIAQKMDVLLKLDSGKLD